MKKSGLLKEKGKCLEIRLFVLCELFASDFPPIAEVENGCYFNFPLDLIITIPIDCFVLSTINL